MKPPSKDVSASLRGQRPSTSGPGPSERGRIKQGMSGGVFPGNRLAGQQPPGKRCDNTAEHFGDLLGSKVGG